MRAPLQNRFSAQLLCIVSLQLALSSSVIIKSSGSSLNVTIPNVHQSSFIGKSNSSTTVVKTYANHRMDDESVVPNTNRNISLLQPDREAASSILRPQLALQIYTNPTQQEQAIRNSPLIPHGYGPTMLIVPVQHKLPDDFHLTSSTNQVRHPHNPKSNHGKVNQWRYLTYQGNSLLEGAPSNGLSEYHASNGPLINTIITVPTSGEQNNRRNHQDNQPQPTQSIHDEEPKNILGADEQSISRLLESQLAGNLEFTMNLNGEEITFNPATNKVRITRPKVKDSGESSDDEGQTLVKRLPSRSKDKNQIISRALKTHIDSDLVGDQQSASDIDLSDSMNEEDETESEYTPNKDEKAIKTRANDDNDSSEREEKLTGSAQSRHWPVDIGEDAEERSKDLDEQAIYESSTENQVTKAKKNKEQLETGTRKGNSKVTKTGGRKSWSNQSVARKANGSKKKVIHKSSEQEDESTEEKVDKDDVPSVVIKSEDVRKFEQLLENLRAISLNTQVKNRRSSGKVRQKPSKAQEVEDDGKDEEFEASGKGWVDSDTKSDPRPAPKASENSETTDCDRKRQQQLQKSDSEEDSSSSYDLDSSPNTMDQEPSNDNESERDNQESSSQMGEQDEQSRNHPQKVAAPQMSSSSMADKQRTSSAREKLKPVIVRKTVVQSYYNDDGDQVAGQRDNFRAIHNSQHESAHEQHMSTPGQLISSSRPQHQEGPSSSSLSLSHQSGPDSYYQSNAQHYVKGHTSYGEDYHQGGDRDAVRASESQRVKTVIRPSRLAIRKLRPLQELIGKVLVKPTGTGRV